MNNLFAAIPENLPEEICESLIETSSMRIERIVSKGHGSPEGFWYDQEWAEWVVVLQGSAQLQFEDEPPLAMAAGNCINIPAHRRHRVQWTDPDVPTIWLAVHYRGDNPG